MASQKENRWSRKDPPLLRHFVTPRHIVDQGGKGTERLGGGPWFLDAELLHPGSQRVGMEAQPIGCTPLSLDDPTHILEDAENVGPLDLFQ